MEVEDDLTEQLKKPKRKPNFTPPERMHLARAYVDNVEEYNRGFTAATRGDAKHGRQRLLEKWATELTQFGVAERTTVEVEQKLRDYMKKIIGNNRRPQRRPLSPAAELLSTVLQQCSTNNDDSVYPVSNGDPQTEYADFLLRQHRATSDESVDTKLPIQIPETTQISYATDLDASTPGTALDFSVHLDDTSRLQRALLLQQLENARAEHALKMIALDNSRIEQRIKLIELERKKLELERIQQLHIYEKQQLQQQQQQNNSHEKTNHIQANGDYNSFKLDLIK